MEYHENKNIYAIDYTFPKEKIQAKEESGWVTLTGEVNCNHQKNKTTVL